jgi:uncharacterized membrane protein YccC
MAAARAPWIESLADAVRFAPVRPAIASGVRAAVATVLPLLLATLVNEPLLSWSSLAGFLTSIVDKGGAYRTRARGMGSVVLGGAAWGALGAAAGGSFAAAMVCAFVGATALAFARVYGPAVASAGTLVLVMLLVSLARPEANLARAVERAAFIAGGGAWAMILSLLFWPVRVYRPARDAVAAAVRAVAVFAADVASAPHESPSSATMFRHRSAIRQALEGARATLAATRRGRRGESGRGERLLIVLESADQVFAALLAVSEVLSSVRARGLPSVAEATATRALSAIAASCTAIAATVDEEHPDGPVKLPALDLGALEAPLSTREGPSSRSLAVEAEVGLVGEILLRARALLEEAAEAASSLTDDRPLSASPTTLEVEPLDAAGAWIAPWRDHLTLRSVVFRHALRVGVTTAIAVALVHHFALERGYWITISAAVTLQPQLPATFLKTLQRVLGTVIGGLVAALLTAALHDPRLMLATVFVLAVVSVSVLPINYGLYAACLTPTFILLAEVNAREPGLVKVRIVNTLIGGTLALAAARIFWPLGENELFPSAAAGALRALRRFFGAVTAEAPPDPRVLDRARRDLGLAILDAEASLQRWMAEGRPRSVDLEAPMVLLVYTRGFVAAVVALASAREAAREAGGEAVGLAPFARAVEGALVDLEAAVLERRTPRPLPSFEREIQEILSRSGAGDGRHTRALLATRLERIAQSLSVQHDAVARWLTALPRGEA